ncbi:MAG: hypothetical protein CR979_01045 [Propionibacterium sp.]|nr:MAG: hypothetical protein CR979_01045 [Propionibacterium sp.]
MRRCSRNACSGVAVATLTFEYESSTAVLGPLALEADPGSYDLCALHAERTTAPVGWEIIKMPYSATMPGQQIADDDLIALAAAVREVGLSTQDSQRQKSTTKPKSRGGTRHLRVVRDDQ